MHFDTVALIAVMALFTCFFAWLSWARYAPLRLAVPSEPQAAGGKPFGVDHPDQSGLGKVGDLATALMHAKDGWQQMPPEDGEGHAVFVRKIGGKTFEVRIVETKCSRDGDPRSSYDAERMADNRVIEQLERLKGATVAGEPYLDVQAIDAITKAIRRRSMHVSKHFYAHALEAGNTLIYSVRRDGELVERPAARVKRVSGAPHRLMLQALAIGLARLDGAGGR